MSDRDLAVARSAAARVWRYRHCMELEAAERFRNLAEKLAGFNASDGIIEMALRASSDEVRHAEQCRDLVFHFGGTVESSPVVETLPVAPRELDDQQRLLYEVVALSCVTESLSTALLGVLVECAQDPVARSALHSILRDEINHSRLGWAFLAAAHVRGAHDCIGEWLPVMLSATLSEELFAADVEVSESDRLLAGFGSLGRAERCRVVRETLTFVVFPGLARFGIDTCSGSAWLQRAIAPQEAAR